MWWLRHGKRTNSMLRNRISCRIWTICFTLKRVNRKMPMRCLSCQRCWPCRHWVRLLIILIWCQMLATWATSKSSNWIWIGMFDVSLNFDRIFHLFFVPVLFILMLQLFQHWIYFRSRELQSRRRHINGKVFWVCSIDAKLRKVIVWWLNGWSSHCEIPNLSKIVTTLFNVSLMQVRHEASSTTTTWNECRTFSWEKKTSV